MATRKLLLTPDNLAVATVAGHRLYVVKTSDAPQWSYHAPITVAELPDLQFKRHLLMVGNKGHKEAIELEVVAGEPPNRADLIGKTIRQDPVSPR
ncbi:MAG TPA: hypothetical protein VK464_21090 [Symbiobacteriaceae bacterium]|jgi:hypothetical protein|nr:hypothetical protein [Symbiobacteriaceae bacterium]